MKTVWSYLIRDYRKETVLAPFFKMLEALFDLLVPLAVAQIIDIGIAENDRGFIFGRAGIMVLLAAAGLLCSFTAQYFAAKASAGCAAALRQSLFDHILGLSCTEQDTLGASTLITRLTSDINQIQTGINMALRLLLRSPFIVFGSVIMALLIDWKAALVFVAAVPVLSAVVYGIMIISIPLFRKVQASLDAVTLSTRENLTGVRVIRAFCREKDEVLEFDRKNEELTRMNEFVGRISALLNPVTYVLINIATIMLINTGAVRVSTGAMRQGDVVALYNYMAQMIVELIKLASLIITINKSIACADRVSSALAVKSSMEYPADTGQGEESYPQGINTADLFNRKETATGDAAHNADEILPGMNTHNTPAAFTGDIPQNNLESKDTGAPGGEGKPLAPAVQFEEVSFTYSGAGADSLTGISFEASKGQTIGIIGGTGSGKSSLVSLIARFYDVTKGKVLVNGKDVRSYPEGKLNELIGIVPQKAVLFKGTIRDNLRWGNEDATDEQLWQALGTAQAREVVEGKEGGLDFELEQNGRNLSGGQRQRLTIARALAKHPEILILDDSASALDFATDACLRKALRGMEGNTTVFIVTQRTSSIMNADRILVLEDGALAGCGTHDRLMRDCGEYQEIFYSQYPEKRPAKEVLA